MLRLGALLMMAAAWGAAQSRLEAPWLGLLDDSAGALRPLYGVAGNFVPGEALVQGAISVACTERWALVKLERQVILMEAGGSVRARWEAPPGEALFAFTAEGDPALVYFSQTGELNGIGPEAPAPLALKDPPVAVGSLDQERAVLIVRREQGLMWQTLRLASGQVEQESLLAPEGGPAVLLPGPLVVYAQGAELRVQAGGGERRLRLPWPAERLRQLSDRWVEIVPSGAAGRMALRVDEESLTLYRLPEVKP